MEGLAKGDVKTAIDAGASIGGAAGVTPEDSYAVVPEGYEIASLERFQDTPWRTRATRSLKRINGLIGYINDFGDAFSVVYADEDRGTITAVLDHSAPEEPRWGEHQAVLRVPHSKEWKAWTTADGHKMPQAAFAEFIEDNLEDIYVPEGTSSPDGSTMLELAQTLNAKRSVDFTSSTKLSDGSGQISFKEEAKDSAGKNGQIEIPESFHVAIPVYEGGYLYQVKAKLRYRVNDGDLRIWFDLHRPEKVVETAFGEMVGRISEETGATVYEGTL